MFFDEHKNITTTILSKRNAKGEKMGDNIQVQPESVKTEDGEVDGRHTAMQDFMAAHKEGSAHKMSQALQNFLDIHGSEQMKAEK